MSLMRYIRRRPDVPARDWGFEVRQFALPRDGVVQYAQWLHPLEQPQRISQAEIDGLRQFIRPGDFAIDVGAHTGDTTLPMAFAAGPSGCVLAVEPNPHVGVILRQNAGLNPDRTNIAVRQFAAVESPGPITFLYSDASYCNGGQALPRWHRILDRKHPLHVEGLNLMEELDRDFANWLPRLSYLKVDAEGHDRTILQTLLPAIEATHPAIRTEVFRKTNRRERTALHRLLADAGYEIFRYVGGESPLGRRVGDAEMCDERHFDLLAVHPDRERQATAA